MRERVREKDGERKERKREELGKLIQGTSIAHLKGEMLGKNN